MTEQNTANSVIKNAPTRWKEQQNAAKIKNIAEFWYENLFFFVIFRNFAAHLRELCNRTWVREGVIGASEYSWSILAKSGGKFMIIEKPQK